MANKGKTRKVGWGRPDIYLKDLDIDGGKWFKSPTPVLDSTQLTPTKGDRKEAKLEGGDNEDVMYLASNYALAYQIRRTSNKKMPIAHVDGVVEHHYAALVWPQNRDAPGLYMPESAVSVEDAFSSAEGGADTYTHDAVLADGQIKKVLWGVFTVSGDDTTGYTITATDGDFGDDSVTL